MGQRLRRGSGALLAAFALTAVPATAEAQVANSAPVCFDATTAIVPGGERTFTLRCNDRDFRPQPLSVEIVGAPSHGTLTVVQGVRVRYVPAAGYTGNDVFTFRVIDGADETAVLTQQLRVTTDNLAPQCHARTVEAVGGYADLRDACYDPNEGDPAMAIVHAQPAHGILEVSQYNHEVRYSTDGYRGPDAFSIRATDGALTGPTAEIDVQAVDLEPPVCDAPPPIPVRTDTAKTPELYCQDNAYSPGGGMMFNWQLVDAPEHGAWGGGYPGRTYTPNPGYTGPDELKVRIGNSAGYGAPITLRFEVADDANTPPRCFGWPTTFYIRTGATRNAPISCWDPENDPLEKTILPEPKHGRLSESTSGSWTTTVFTADDDYAGPDRYGVSASDGRTESSILQEIAIVGDDENEVPDCMPASRWSYSGAKMIVAIPCMDREGDPMTFAVEDGPDHGAVAPAAGPFGGAASWEYTPAAGFAGLDRMTVTADDGRGQTRPIAVLFEVKPRTAPRCRTPEPREVRTNAEEHVYLVCDDNGQALFPVVHEQPAHGTVTTSGHGDYFYEPAQDFQGSDSFTLRATNDIGTVDVEVLITVSDDANKLPACYPAWQATIRQGEPPLAVDVECHDPDGDPVTIETVTGPAHGTLGAWDQAEERVTYTPAAGYEGEDEFTFRASDGRGHSPTVSQPVRVRGENENSVPHCTSRHIWVAPDQPTTTYGGCSDPDGDDLTMAIASQPEHGTASAPNTWGEFTYTPDAGFVGVDEIGVTATDDHGGTSAVATITVHVGETTSEPSQPRCTSFAANVDASGSRRVQLVCTTAPFPGEVVPEVVDGPGHGTLGTVDSAGWVTYAPEPGFVGVDRFTYRGTKDGQTSELATVELHVSVPAPPEEDAPPADPPAPPRNDPPPPPPPPAPAPENDPAERMAEQRLGGDAVPLGDLDLGATRAFVPAAAGGGVLKVDAPREKLLALVCATNCDVVAGQHITLGAGGARAAARAKPIRLKAQRLQLRAGQPGVVVVRLTKAQRKRIRRARRATLTVKVAVKDASGRTVRDTARFRLRAR